MLQICMTSEIILAINYTPQNTELYTICCIIITSVKLKLLFYRLSTMLATTLRATRSTTYDILDAMTCSQCVNIATKHMNFVH